MIHHFLNYYDTILLVSHLETIRDTADVHIQVIKEKGISRLTST